MGNQRPRLSADARSAAADAVLIKLDGGRLSIYDVGADVPDSPDDPLQGATLLVELPFATGHAFNRASRGVAAANALESGTAVASGAAQFFRCWAADERAVLDGLVGRSDSDLNLSVTAIRAGATVSITSFQYRQAG